MVVYFCFKFFLNFVIVRIFWLVLFFFLNYKRKEKFGDYNRLYEIIKGVIIFCCVYIIVSVFILVEGKIV